MNLDQFGYTIWRSACGTVMQDGFIFSDTIGNNIAIGDEFPDPQKLENAIKIANINDFIDGLPFGLHTKIGPFGNGISQGQRQRLLIARPFIKIQTIYFLMKQLMPWILKMNERLWII